MQRLPPNDINQVNEAGAGFATAAMNPEIVNLRAKKPDNLGMTGINRTRFTPFNILAGLVNKQALPDNRWRNYLMFQNNSANGIYVGFGINVGVNGEGGFLISAGGFYELDNTVPFNSIFVLALAANSQLVVVEGTIDRAQKSR
jgi:hypothetical protein